MRLLKIKKSSIFLMSSFICRESGFTSVPFLSNLAHDFVKLLSARYVKQIANHTLVFVLVDSWLDSDLLTVSAATTLQCLINAKLSYISQVSSQLPVTKG